MELGRAENSVERTELEIEIAVLNSAWIPINKLTAISASGPAPMANNGEMLGRKTVPLVAECGIGIPAHAEQAMALKFDAVLSMQRLLEVASRSPSQYLAMILIDDSVEELLERCAAYTPPSLAKASWVLDMSKT